MKHYLFYFAIVFCILLMSTFMQGMEKTQNIQEQHEILDKQLLQACLTGDETLALQALEAGAQVNKLQSVEEGMFSPLHIAVQKGHSPLLNILFKYGANVNMSAPNGEPLILSLHCDFVGLQRAKREISKRVFIGESVI